MRTLSRDLKALARRNVVVPLRSQQKDAGRALSHRVQIVELYLQRYTYTQIRQRMYHSLPAIANYLTSFALVVAHIREGRSVEEMAFLMQISPALVREYQRLYEHYNVPAYQERLDEILATVKARGFQPSQLEDPATPSASKKGVMA